MNARSSAFMNTLQDVGVTLFLFAHWTLVAFFVDAAGNGETLRMGASIYLAVITSAVTLFLLWQSYTKLGTKNAGQRNPETILGLWCEILNIVQSFGMLFLMARVLSLDSTHVFNSRSFLHNAANSAFEMSTTMGGVGYVAEPPVTLAERTVAFLSIYIGGVLFMNMFILSALFGRRTWFNVPEEREPMIPSAPAPVQAIIDNWKLNSIISAKA